MNKIEFLTVDQVIAIQKLTLPNSGSPDIGKLEGALSRIQNLKDYENCQDVFRFAAMYLIAIAKAHAFLDANKRTAFQATSTFLILNGYELNESDELVNLTISAATGESDIENVTSALKSLSNYKTDFSL
ncbi:type II toxin-antitoxin system death-on-curing family toxin [uncultured Gilliamella sp.]|uniref:type II toxin-antitoxin system death-on-curing family toxin n=1 Tax=uncultured Gilliamella sp. TaxID=1193505 RepID=UPI0025CB886B|nr:type II toxin-antitoxin system death-on-curing family toxin [uncultured Gilliamella sp.]